MKMKKRTNRNQNAHTLARTGGNVQQNKNEKSNIRHQHQQFIKHSPLTNEQKSK